MSKIDTAATKLNGVVRLVNDALESKYYSSAAACLDQLAREASNLKMLVESPYTCQVTISTSGFTKLFIDENEAIEFFGKEEFDAIKNNIHSEYTCSKLI